MLNKKSILSIFAVLGVFFMLGSAHAWPLITGPRGAWGVDFGNWASFPNGTNHANFCVANSMNSSGGCQKKMGIHGDDEAVVGLVAWQILDNGGYFCVTQFQCEGKSKSWTWNLAPQGTQKCFWLCKNGYSGNGCVAINESEYNLSSDSPACPQTSISRSDFSSNNVKTSGNTGLNQENNIHLLHNRYDGKKEMDVMVGVSGWLDNKKGVVASPFLFHCTNRAHSNTMDINFYPSYASHNLCLPGYTGANCEKCKATNMCAGYTATQFDSSLHTMSANGSCSEFRCTDTNKGFNSSSDRASCVDCGTLGGVGKDGVCVKCSVGQIFDKTSKACKDAVKIATPEMRYGMGKSTEPANVLDACWTKVDPREYECCVRNKSWDTATSTCK